MYGTLHNLHLTCLVRDFYVVPVELGDGACKQLHDLTFRGRFVGLLSVAIDFWRELVHGTKFLPVSQAAP